MAGRYRAYPEYRDSGVEWLGDIPNHWTVCRVKNVAELNPSKSEVRDLPADTEVTFIPMEAIGESGELDVSKSKQLLEVINGYTYVAEGDVMLAKITPCFENGKSAIAIGLKNGIGFATTEVIPVRPHRHSDNLFIYYLLHCNPFKALAEGSMYGAGGQKRVADSFVAEYHFALPEKAERDGIVDFVQSETAKIDTLIEKQQQLIKLLKEKRQAVISHAVTKGLNPNVPMKDSGVEWLGEVPAHWEVAKLAHHYEVLLGKMLDDKKITGEHMGAYLRNTDVQWGRINTDDLPQMDFRPEEQERYSVRKGDLLVCEGGEIGRCAIWQQDEPCFYQKALHRLRPYDVFRNNAQYLFYVLFDAVHQERFIAGAGKATIAHLPAETFRQYRFTFPPIEEQSAIAVYLDAQSAKFELLEARAHAQIELLQKRRTALISAAVTGKIDVRDWQPPAGADTTPNP